MSGPGAGIVRTFDSRCRPPPDSTVRSRRYFFFDIGAWSEELAESYLALGRVDDAVRVITDATRGGYSEGAEMLCEWGETDALRA